MAKKKGEMALAKQFDPKQIPSYLQQLKDRKDQLVGEVKEEVATDGNLMGNLEGFTSNISETQDINILIRMAGAVKDRERIHADGIEALGLDAKNHPFKIGKWSAETWINDINRQMKLVTHKDELAKIDKAINIVEQYQTEEQKFNNDMQTLAHLLSVDE